MDARQSLLPPSVANVIDGEHRRDRSAYPATTRPICPT
ncbi:hypothetical protein LA76x_5114 [Lysobacter antibioticus]|uniref:Uncharacterized protein n=1 Tax=Lysobacter antibioticus TaxID=84531 RepID=A0A0S2FI86_LYSAN|nr:hypothetical protein LA76x_5114 [Lysobacter antibioticus]